MLSAPITVLDVMMADVPHTHSAEEKITAAIKNTVDFGWFNLLVVHLTTMRYWMVLHGMLLEYLFLGGASEEKGHWWKQAGRGLQGGVENSVVHMSHLESYAYLFSCITSFFLDAWLTRAHTTSMCHELSDLTPCCHNGCHMQGQKLL